LVPVLPRTRCGNGIFSSSLRIGFQNSHTKG
jgi:hypothetical protein